MPANKGITEVSLTGKKYVPVIQPDNRISYGGNQCWYPDHNRFSTAYILHNYGCGTIAVGDLFLYLALTNPNYRTSEINSVIRNGVIKAEDYKKYILSINKKYTKTPLFLGVLGPKMASAVNALCTDNGIPHKACWEWALSYKEMLDKIMEMLRKNIPVIFSVGPNTPNIFGNKSLNLYQSENSKHKSLPPDEHVHGHYMVITGVTINHQTNRITLTVSSWGRRIFIDYTEYRRYIDNVGGRWTSSMVYIR